MVEKKKFEYKYPNDDGKRQRAWITDPDERGKSASDRVVSVLTARKWLRGVVETIRCGDDDSKGIDIFMGLDKRLEAVTGVWNAGQAAMVQVKSCEHEQRKFQRSHADMVFNVRERKHIFVLDGQDAMDVIVADLLGQMIVLSLLAGTSNEETFLLYMEEIVGDAESVARYRENRELLLEEKWYGDVIVQAGGRKTGK